MNIEKIVDKIFNPDLTKRFQVINDKAIEIALYPVLKLYEYFKHNKEEKKA